MIWLALGAAYLAGAVFTYGYTLAWWQRTFPFIAADELARDRCYALRCAVAWPFDWPAQIALCIVKGRKFWRGMQWR